MIKVVLDCNLFISAILTPTGNSAKIIDLVRDKTIELCVSSSILLEVRTVLLYPKVAKFHKYNTEQINDLLKNLSLFADFTPEKISLNIIKDDPSDNKFIECAVEAKADYIISGDKHLKDLKKYKNIKIISPAEFLRMVK